MKKPGENKLSASDSKTARRFTAEAKQAGIFTMLMPRWYDIVQRIENTHCKKMLENPGWTLADTARITGYSIGYISESLRLARELVHNPKLLNCQDREQALGKIRPNKEIFPNNTSVLVKLGHSLEKGVVVGRGTTLPRETVWIVKLDEPFYVERLNRRVSLIVCKTSELMEMSDA